MEPLSRLFAPTSAWLKRAELTLGTMAHIPQRTGYLRVKLNRHGELRVMGFGQSRVELEAAMRREHHAGSVSAVLTRAEAERLAIARHDSPRTEYPRLLAELVGTPPAAEREPARRLKEPEARPHWRGAVLVPVE